LFLNSRPDIPSVSSTSGKGGFLAKYERAPVAETAPGSRRATSRISF
jgi:hypothetical protein